MSDERIDKLGSYFTHWDIQARYGITFEQFVHLVNVGRWEEIVRGN